MLGRFRNGEAGPSRQHYLVRVTHTPSEHTKKKSSRVSAPAGPGEERHVRRCHGGVVEVHNIRETLTSTWYDTNMYFWMRGS